MNKGMAIAAVAGAVAGAAWWINRGGTIGGETALAPGLIDYGYQAIDAFESGGSVNADQNLKAFFKAVRYGEGTASAYGYQTLYGGALFNSYADHPALMGWPGVKLTTAQCAGAGFGPGCVSTAAGAYQINKPTWLRIKDKLGLPDFSPASQDAAAIELIRERGALSDVQAGRIASAIDKVRKIWASLPGAGYGQHEVALTTFNNQYLENGGALA